MSPEYSFQQQLMENVTMTTSQRLMMIFLTFLVLYIQEFLVKNQHSMIINKIASVMERD